MTQRHEDEGATEDAGSRFYQLALTTDVAPVTPPPNFQYVQLAHAQPAAVGEVLRRLYLPVGVHGLRPCVVIYATTAEWRATSEFVHLLDVPVVDNVTASIEAAPTEAFRELLGRFMGNVHGGRVEWAGTADLAPLFEKLASVETAAPAVRWAAAMLAGDILLGGSSDFSRAEQLFLLAEGQAPAGSIEQLNAVYARARAQRLRGKDQRAAELCSRILRDFTLFHRCEPYMQARRELEALTR